MENMVNFITNILKLMEANILFHKGWRWIYWAGADYRVPSEKL